MSVLIDEPPKKKRKSASGEKVISSLLPTTMYRTQTDRASLQKAVKPKEKKTAKSTSGGKDEDTIKRLKVCTDLGFRSGHYAKTILLATLVSRPCLWCQESLVQSLPGYRQSQTTDQKNQGNSL